MTHVDCTIISGFLYDPPNSDEHPPGDMTCLTQFLGFCMSHLVAMNTRQVMRAKLARFGVCVSFGLILIGEK